MDGWEYRSFSPNELAICPCCDKLKRDDIFFGTLQMCRDLYNSPMSITSGYRCPKHNEAIGGSPTSSHLKACAADISATSPQHLSQLMKVLPTFFDRIGVAKNFIHVDSDRAKPEALWTY
jgi:uncharacterized protein YcbK (DUF882 family)